MFSEAARAESEHSKAEEGDSLIQTSSDDGESPIKEEMCAKALFDIGSFDWNDDADVEEINAKELRYRFNDPDGHLYNSEDVLSIIQSFMQGEEEDEDSDHLNMQQMRSNETAEASRQGLPRPIAIFTS